MIEHFFSCPYCWTQISILIDSSIQKQQYVEDCENCCNPIEIFVQIEQGRLLSFHAEKINP